VNGITFVITDGDDNASTATAKMVKEELKQSVKGEIMESHLSILIGIDTGYSGAKDVLENFQKETGMDTFSWAGEATKGKLAKLAVNLVDVPGNGHRWPESEYLGNHLIPCDQCNDHSQRGAMRPSFFF
jgi:hypothetical protein